MYFYSGLVTFCIILKEIDIVRNLYVPSSEHSLSSLVTLTRPVLSCSYKERMEV